MATIDKTNPVELLFAADRRLRDAATDYHTELLAHSADEPADGEVQAAREALVRNREDDLRQAALDYAAVDRAIWCQRFGIVLPGDTADRLAGEG